MAVKKFSVSNDKNIYEAWPDIVLTDSGKLICVFSECTHHTNRENARLMITESTDRGRTWSPKTPLTEKGTDVFFFNCARISKLNDGSLAILCDKIEGRNEENAVVYLWRGDSDGKNWSEPVALPCRGIVPDKLLQLKNGRLIVGAHLKNQSTGMLEQYLWYSDDDAKTWSERITVAADKAYNICEVSFLETTDGVLVAFMRENSAKGYDCLKAISYDNGESWSKLGFAPLPGCHRPVSGFLNDGSVMLTYRFLQGKSDGDVINYQNTFAAFFTEDVAKKLDRDEQQTRIMPLDYDRNPKPDTGYTGWVQFDDGEIYIVNYIKDDANKAQIRGYSLTLEDVILSE